MSSWVPESQRGTDYYIFNSRFSCKVPYLGLRSLDDVRRYGVPVSGEPDIDRGLAGHLVQTSLTIAKMTELFAQGIPVYLTNPETDAKKIYERVFDHLVAWQQVISNSFNPGNPPLEDLRNLLSFAKAVFPHAERHATLAEAISGLQRKMDQHGVVPIHDVFKRKPPVVAPKVTTEAENGLPPAPVDRPEHKSMAEAFADRRPLSTGDKTRW